MIRNPTYPKCFAKFSNKSLDLMKDLAEKSKIIEFGATICMDRNRKIDLGNVCSGDKCSVNITKGCQIGQEIGEFHTHPYNEIPPFPNDIPSPDDWSRWIINNHFLSCLGSKKYTRCYQKKYDFESEEENTIKSLVTNMEISESHVENIESDPKLLKLKKLLKYNDEIEEYFYKFDPIECKV
jgi:hypothetical protein